jgi:hypothetical protein
MDAKTLISFNTEAVKLAAMGVTVVAASGDSGVANFDCTCYKDSGSAASPGWTGTSWDGAGYFPVFPASSPWVRTHAREVNQLILVDEVNHLLYLLLTVLNEVQCRGSVVQLKRLAPYHFHCVDSVLLDSDCTAPIYFRSQ